MDVPVVWLWPRETATNLADASRVARSTRRRQSPSLTTVTFRARGCCCVKLCFPESARCRISSRRRNGFRPSRRIQHTASPLRPLSSRRFQQGLRLVVPARARARVQAVSKLLLVRERVAPPLEQSSWVAPATLPARRLFPVSNRSQ